MEKQIEAVHHLLFCPPFGRGMQSPIDMAQAHERILQFAVMGERLKLSFLILPEERITLRLQNIFVKQIQRGGDQIAHPTEDARRDVRRKRKKDAVHAAVEPMDEHPVVIGQRCGNMVEPIPLHRFDVGD